MHRWPSELCGVLSASWRDFGGAVRWAPRAPGTSTSMPSRDPATGKRLHGGAIRKRRAEKAQAVALVEAGAAPELPVPAAFVDVAAPPYGRGVDAVEAWAACVSCRAASAVATATDETAPRIAFVVGSCRELGRLVSKASRSEAALRLRRLRLGESDTVDIDVPPDDPVASVAWAFMRLARLTFEAATSPGWAADPRRAAEAKALAGVGFLACNAQLDALADRVETTS